MADERSDGKSIFEKSKDKKPKLGDYIMVEMAKGVPVTIERENMTDSEWEKVKKNARDSGTLVEDMTGDKLPASQEDQKRIENLGKKIEKAIIQKDERENPDLQDLELETKREGGGGGGTLISKAARMAAEVVTGAAPKGRTSVTGHERTRVMPELNISGRSPHDDGTRRMPEMDISPTNEITQEDVDAFETRKNLENSVKENEAKAQMQEGLDLTTPESRLAAAAYKRAGEPASYTEVTGGEQSVNSTVTDNEDTSVTRPVQRFGQNNTPVDPLMPPPEPSLIQKIDTFGNELAAPLRDGVAAVGRILTPTPTPNEQQLAAREDLAASSAAPTQVGAMSAPPPGAGSPPPAPGGSFSASVKTTTPGSGELPPAADPYAAERRMMQGAAETIKGAEREKVKVEEAKSKAEAEILDQKIKFTAQNEEKRLAAMNTYEETLARGQTTMNMIADERRKLMNTVVDPDAYFTKGGIGRKVLSALSGAAFGWLGQGPQLLQRLDNLMQQEVKNQQDELARRSGELSLIAGDKKNVIAMAREQGMNAVESLAAARVSFYQSVQDQLSKIAAENPTLQQTAMIKMAEIDQKLAGDLMTLKQATQMAAHQNVQDRVAMMNANTNRMEAKARITAAGEKSGKGVPMKPGEKKRMAEFLTLGDTLSRMSKEYKEARGNSWAATGAVSKAVGIGGSTKSNRWDKEMDTFTQLIGKPIEGGVLREADTARYKGSYIPNVSDTDELAAQKQRGLLDYATAQYANEYNGHVATDAEGIENYPSPEVFRRMLEESMLGPQVPGEKPYGKK